MPGCTSAKPGRMMMSAPANPTNGRDPAVRIDPLAQEYKRTDNGKERKRELKRD